MMPLVSILVPVYQVEDCIERCARSLFGQSYDNLEYVFVDDASTDDSMQILHQVARDFPHRLPYTKIVRHDHNRGLAASRNTAVAACTGEFICHVDADDWMELNGVELLVNCQLHTNADIVTGQAYNHTTEFLTTEGKYSGWDLSREELLASILQYKASTSLWRRIIRKSLYTDHNIQADVGGSGGEDYQVLPRLLYYANKIAGIEERIYHYNLYNQHSITNNLSISLDIQKQGYNSVCVIADFFANKEQQWKKLIQGLKIRHLYLRMKQNQKWGNLRGYIFFRDQLLSTDSSEWHFIKWDSVIVRYIDTHYTLLQLFSPIIDTFFLCKSIAYRIVKE